MKVDKVLEAHGIGIVQLNPPVIPSVGVVTNGLVGYWNSKRGVSGTTWENIAPATVGQFNAIIEGATVTTDGMLFDGSNDHVQIQIPTAMKVVTSATFEMRFRSNGGTLDMINQDGRELMWVDDNFFVASGIFDAADRYSDHMYIWANMSPTYYLTITADLTTNRITGYLHNPATGRTETGSYTTTIGTFAEGNFFWLSGTNLKFKGIMDSVRLYNRVLTAEEIAQNRAVGTGV